MVMNKTKSIINNIDHQVGEHTTLSKASSKNDSLRTTVPASIVHILNLGIGDIIDWEVQAHNNEIRIVVKKVGKGQRE